MGKSSINLMPSCHGSTIIIVIFVFQIFFYGVISDNNDIDKMKPVEDLVQRIIPQYADQFSYILNSNELGNNAASICTFPQICGRLSHIQAWANHIAFLFSPIPSAIAE